MLLLTSRVRSSVLADTLSRRAAVAVASCPRRGGPWLKCPNQYFVDVANVRVRSAMGRSCVTNGTTDTRMEDLLVGACLAEAGNIVRRTHHCIVSQGNREDIVAKAGRARDLIRNAHLQKLCACPVALHAIKDPTYLLRARRLVQEECVAACGDAMHAADSVCSLYLKSRP